MDEFLKTIRKYLPADWDVRVENGRVEVREWAERPGPLFSFSSTHNEPDELLKGLPEIIGAMIGEVHRDYFDLKSKVRDALSEIPTDDVLKYGALSRGRWKAVKRWVAGLRVLSTE